MHCFSGGVFLPYDTVGLACQVAQLVINYLSSSLVLKGQSDFNKSQLEGGIWACSWGERKFQTQGEAGTEGGCQGVRETAHAIQLTLPFSLEEQRMPPPQTWEHSMLCPRQMSTVWGWGSCMHVTSINARSTVCIHRRRAFFHHTVGNPEKEPHMQRLCSPSL